MKKLVFLLPIAWMLSACNGSGNNPNIEVIPNMMDQVSIKSQDWNPQEGDKVQMRAPPAHAVARGHKPYKYAEDPIAAEKQPNPFASDRSPELVELGKRQYTIYCGVCHGAGGAGDGTVADKMAVKPRSLINPESKAFTDGRIYHAITAGRGVMGSYAGQIPNEKARWAVVNYVRSLQRQ